MTLRECPGLLGAGYGTLISFSVVHCRSRVGPRRGEWCVGGAWSSSQLCDARAVQATLRIGSRTLMAGTRPAGSSRPASGNRRGLSGSSPANTAAATRQPPASARRSPGREPAQPYPPGFPRVLRRPPPMPCWRAGPSPGAAVAQACQAGCRTAVPWLLSIRYRQIPSAPRRRTSLAEPWKCTCLPSGPVPSIAQSRMTRAMLSLVNTWRALTFSGRPRLVGVEVGGDVGVALDGVPVGLDEHGLRLVQGQQLAELAGVEPLDQRRGHVFGLGGEFEGLGHFGLLLVSAGLGYDDGNPGSGPFSPLSLLRPGCLAGRPRKASPATDLE